MDGRCATCRWWEKHPQGEEWPPDEPWGECIRVLVGFPGSPHIDGKAIAMSDRGDKGVLETAHDFGCVQFEPKGA